MTGIPFPSLVRVSPGLVFLPVSQDRALLRGATRKYVIEGTIAVDILRNATQPISAAELISRGMIAGGEVEVLETLSSLIRRGYIVEAVDQVSSQFTQFDAIWTGLGVNSADARRIFLETKVFVQGDKQGYLINKLCEIGLINSVASGADLDVYVTDNLAWDGWADVNLNQLSTGKPWCLIQTQGPLTLFGPVFRAGGGGCWQCLADSYLRNHPVDRFLINNGHTIVVTDTLNLVSGLEIAALEIAKWFLLGAKSDLECHLFRIGLDRLSATRHLARARPQCLACGAASLSNPSRSPSPLRLNTAEDDNFSSWGLRTRTPSATVKEWSKHIDPVLGVVNYCNELELDSGLRLCITSADVGGLDYSYAGLQRALEFRALGKGITSDHAKASALGEAFERYSAVFRGDEIRRFSSMSDFTPDECIDPRSSQLFSRKQYESASGVPCEFDPEVPCEWSPLWSLTDQQWYWLPTEYLYFSYPVDKNVCPADSNGLAAGNTLAEAIVHGFLELIERDAYAIWWYNTVSPPLFPLHDITSDDLKRYLEIHRSMDREVRFLDLTHDAAIPVVVAVSWVSDNSGPQKLLFSAGAHFDPRVAALRAMGEINHRIVALEKKMKFSDSTVRWLQSARLENFPQFAPSGNRDNLSRFYEQPQNPLEFCIAAAKRLNVQFLVAEMTRPDVNVSVAKVVCPGLRHYWPRFAPGRLYDVPVRLGWLRTPRAESELACAPDLIFS